MTVEYRNRLRKFLSGYLDIHGPAYDFEDEIVVKQGIKLLIDGEIFTVKGLKRAALREQNIFISDEFINECIAMKN